MLHMFISMFVTKLEKRRCKRAIPRASFANIIST